MFHEKQHFYALSFSHPNLLKLSAVVHYILGDNFSVIKNLSMSSDLSIKHLSFYSLNAFHRIPPDELDQTRTKLPKMKKYRGKLHYIYDCYLIKFDYQDRRPFYLFASPYKAILNEQIDAEAPKLKSEKLSFYSINLIKLLKIYETGKIFSNFNITRINFQSIVDTPYLKSLAMYGDNVLHSESYLRIKSFTSPSSVRLLYADNDKGLALNTDRSGNWSFYLRFQNDLKFFDNFYRFFSDENLIDVSYNDPRRSISSSDERLQRE